MLSTLAGLVCRQCTRDQRCDAESPPDAQAWPSFSQRPISSECQQRFEDRGIRVVASATPAVSSLRGWEWDDCIMERPDQIPFRRRLRHIGACQGRHIPDLSVSRPSVPVEIAGRSDARHSANPDKATCGRHSRACWMAPGYAAYREALPEDTVPWPKCPPCSLQCIHFVCQYVGVLAEPLSGRTQS